MYKRYNLHLTLLCGEKYGDHRILDDINRHIRLG